MRTQGDQEILAYNIMPAAGSRHGIDQPADIFMADFALQFAGQIIFHAEGGGMFNCRHSANPCPKDGIWQAATGGKL
jgi:hypothetical protein